MKAFITSTFFTATTVPEALCFALNTLPYEPLPNLHNTSNTLDGGFESSDSSSLFILKHK